MQDKIEDLLREIENELQLEYDDGDPSMAALGEDAWFDQVGEMSHSLSYDVYDAVESHIKDLHDGQFYHESMATPGARRRGPSRRAR